MVEIIDEKDRKILEILKENSSLSTHKISKKTLIPVTTVNNRIKKLNKEGVIKKYTVQIDEKKIGINLTAYIFVQVSLKDLKQNNLKVSDLVKEIRKNPIVESAENVAGDIDLVVKVHARDMDELKNYVLNNLSDMRGVEKTTTAIIMEHK